MNEIELTWTRALSVWWLIAWRSVVGGVLIAGAFGFVIGLIGALIGVDRGTLSLTGAVVGIVFGLVWHVMVVRMALRKKYREFRIVLMPRDAA